MKEWSDIITMEHIKHLGRFGSFDGFTDNLHIILSRDYQYRELVVLSDEFQTHVSQIIFLISIPRI